MESDFIYRACREKTHFFVLLSGVEFSSFLTTAPSVAGVLVLYICTAVSVVSYVFAFVLFYFVVQLLSALQTTI